MPELSKATLQEVDNQNRPRAGRAAVAVQFNPSSLRLQYINQSEGGRSAGRQARQHTGNGSVTLTVELVFDTADEGSTAVPRSVLERTRQIEAFITPQAQSGRNQAPPRLRFHWGDVIVDGVLDTLSVDIDHFAHNGTPLRAKASLSIKGQDPERDANRSGAGANTAVGAAAGSAGSGAGASAGGVTAALPGGLGLGLALGGVSAAVGSAFNSAAQGGTVARALDGESLTALAARNGLPPEAWRLLAGGVKDPLRLPAGQDVSLPNQASAGPGAGAFQGVQSGAAGATRGGAAATPAAQRVGLTAPPNTTQTSTGALQRGYALAAAGGLGAALETVNADAGAADATTARRSFAGAGGSTTATVDPLTAATTTPGQRSQVFSLRADPRAQSFGRGVPLRDRVQTAQDTRANLLSGQAFLKRQSTLLPPTTSDPGVPGWEALSLAPAGAVFQNHARGCGCGCQH